MALTLGSMGAFGPYLAVELRERGMVATALTLTMTALPLARVALGPAWGALADHTRREAATLRLASAVSMAGAFTLAFGPDEAMAPAALVFTVGSIGTIPVLDGITLNALGGDPRRYGVVRRWGSVGFLVVTLLAGALKQTLGVSPLVVGALTTAAALALTFTLPESAPAPRASPWPALRRLLAARGMGALLLAGGLHLAALSVYHVYFAVLAEDLGLSAGLTGLAIAGGIVVEIGVMSASATLLERPGPARLFLLAAAVSLPRYVATAFVDSGTAQVVLQLLHGLSFGAGWLGLVALVATRAPKEITHSAQGLLGGTVGGLGAILGSLVGGALLQGWGAPSAFLGAAGLSAASVVLGVLALDKDEV